MAQTGLPAESGGKNRMTVAVLTLNEAERLPGCLAAIPARYPVIVVDSGSTDETVAIARQAGARVITNPWPGFAAQRNHCLGACRAEADWVLFIDADEVFPSAFFDWWDEVTSSGEPAFDAALIPSLLVFNGRVLRHAPGYPILHVRLVRTLGVRFVPNDTGHGETVAQPVRLTTCPIAYLHYFYDGDLAGWLRKHVDLARMEVTAQATSGHLTARGWLNRTAGRGLARIPLRFLYHYLWRGGFRDGDAGFRYAAMYTWYEATKWLLRRAASPEPPPSPPPSPAELALIATHIAPSRGFGGVAESAHALASAWARQGRSFAVTASDGSRGPPIEPADLGMPSAVPVRLYRARLAVRWGFGLCAPAAIWQTCREARQVYVCGIATWPTTLAVLACLMLRRPYVVAPRGGLMPAHVAHIRQNKPLKWLFYRLLVFPALRRARAVHATSGPERDGVLAVVPGVPVAMIANGVDVDFWQALPPPRRAANDSCHLCYVGRLSPEKGIGRFLGLWLEARGPADRLTLVGDGTGAYADAVRRLAQDGGAAVTLLGTQDRSGVRKALAACDFAVLPSGLEGGDVRENFGNTVAEALAAGRPVLVTRGLAWDGLEPAGAAILFEPTAESVKSAIRAASRVDTATYDRMAAAALSYARSDLDITATATALWNIVTAASRPAGGIRPYRTHADAGGG